MPKEIFFNLIEICTLRQRYSLASTVILFLPFFFFFQIERAVAEPFIFGVTIDDPWNTPEGQHAEIKDALASHAVKPTVRIVFDECMYIADNKCVGSCNECGEASEYYDSISNIKSVAIVMGEILDSAYVKNYSVEQYINRTVEYLNQFEDIVDIWEIGNEVNGSWLGTTADVVAKIEGAYMEVKGRDLTTALNLYYNKTCLYNKPEHEMFAWANANISEEMKNGLDYVFFSYYEDDCGDKIYTQAEWQEVFDRLHVIFPNAKLGFGEIGTQNSDKKAEQMHRYYELDIKGDYFVGGYFWWYYKQDCVPKTTELWNTMNSIILQQKSQAIGWLPAIFHLLSGSSGE